MATRSWASVGLKEEIRSVLEVGEALLPEIAALHPEDIVMDDAIRVELHGRYGESPYVDDEGTVHVWRFSKEEGGYHALGLMRTWSWGTGCWRGGPRWRTTARGTRS